MPRSQILLPELPLQGGRHGIFKLPLPGAGGPRQIVNPLLLPPAVPSRGLPHPWHYSKFLLHYERRSWRAIVIVCAAMHLGDAFPVVSSRATLGRLLGPTLAFKFMLRQSAASEGPNRARDALTAAWRPLWRGNLPWPPANNLDACTCLASLMLCDLCAVLPWPCTAGSRGPVPFRTWAAARWLCERPAVRGPHIVLPSAWRNEPRMYSCTATPALSERRFRAAGPARLRSVGLFVISCNPSACVGAHAGGQRALALAPYSLVLSCWVSGVRVCLMLAYSLTVLAVQGRKEGWVGLIVFRLGWVDSL